MFLIIGIVVLCILIHYLKMLQHRKKINVPGPLPLPIVGNGLMFIGSSLHFWQTVTRTVTTYGPALYIQVLFETYIVLTHPDYIEPIISNPEHNTKGYSYKYMEPWLGKGLLTSSDNRWKAHRKFLTPAFHFNILQNFLPVFCKNTRILVQKLKKRADGIDSISLFPIVALAALDNVTESVMGVCVNAQEISESKYVKAIEDVSNVICNRMRNPFLQVKSLFYLLPIKRKQDTALDILHETTKTVIQARRKELTRMNITSLELESEFGIKNKYAFLDLLLLAEIDGERIDDEKVREEVDTFMFEGHDTVTSGIVFALYSLSNLKDIQEKLLQEQKAIFGNNMDRDPTYSELSEMKYLEAVIKESLRLYPSVPVIQRLITKDSDIAGIHLPKGTTVFIDIFHMQRRSEVFDAPLEFRPERFLGDSKELKNAFAWVPFSAGPRNCIGQRFAMMELKVTLSAIIKNFKILPSGEEPLLCNDLVLRSANGVHVQLIPRK